MAPRHPAVYPKSNGEIVLLLKKLGFKKKVGIGRGKHPQKYIHPTRKNNDLNDKPFVLVTHEYFDANGKRLMKKLRNWGFSKSELEDACQDM